MAYSIHFGTVTASEIAAYQSHGIEQLAPSRQALGSHISPNYIEDSSSLQELMREAFDGGGTLRADLWHPLRVPLFHPADRVAALAPAMAREFDEMLSRLDELMAGAYRDDLGGVVSLFKHAADANLCVVTTLDLPFDSERAEKVQLPFPGGRS